MSDTEAIDLIEHYRWSLHPQDGVGGWCVGSDDWDVFGATIRDAVRAALAEQARRAMTK